MPPNPRRILVIDAQAEQRITTLRQYAEQHVYSFVFLMELAATGRKEGRSISDDSNHVIFLHDGYRVVFSHEEASPGKIWRHLSVSVNAEEGVLPSIPSVALIAGQFGFALDLTDPWTTPPDGPVVWIENNKAINLMEPVDGTWPEMTRRNMQ